MTRRSQLPARPVAAAGVVALRRDAVLLVRRGNEPSRGQWSFPGGSIHPGETAREAARREAREETGLDLRVLDVVGIYDGIYPGSDDRPGFHYCVANFLAVPTDETEPRARSDATDACWAPLGDLDAYGITDPVRSTLARALGRHRQLVPADARACPRVEGLYVITDEALAPGRSHLDITRAAVVGGARIVQLRDKSRDTGELVRLTRELLAITRPAGASLIVNDRVDVALAAGADGVHLGTSDMAVADARRLLGPLPLVGYSPETAQQARASARDGADYLGVGDLYGTATKPDAGEPVGLGHLTALGAASGLPVVGIGGITRERIPAVLAAGAAGVAVVSAVVRAPDMEAAVRALCRAFPDAESH